MPAQNVELEYFQQSLQPDLAPLGYKGQFVAAPGGGAIGVATFWNTGTFKLLKVRRRLGRDGSGRTGSGAQRAAPVATALQRHCHR